MKVYFDTKTMSEDRKKCFHENLAALGSIEWIELSPELIKDFPKSLAGGSFVLLDRDSSWGLLSKLKSIPTEIGALQQADSLFFEHGQWIPKFFWKEALIAAIASAQPQLNTRRDGYICGSEASLRSSVAVLSQLGISSIFIIQNAMQDLRSTVQKLQRHFFQLKIEVLLLKSLSTRANTGSILINEFSLDGDQVLMEALSYLNYIGAQGVVTDLCLANKDNQLREEARNVKLSLVRGEEVQLNADLLICKFFSSLPSSLRS